MKDSAKICKECGFLADTDEEDFLENNSFKEEDKFSCWWELFGFLMPLIGLVLYIAWRRDLPRRAHSVGKGALIGWVTRLIISLIISVIFLVFWLVYFFNIQETFK